LTHRWGVCIVRTPHPQAERAVGAKRAPAQRERKGGDRKVLRSKPGGRLTKLAELLGALAWTTAGAKLLPLRAKRDRKILRLCDSPTAILH